MKNNESTHKIQEIATLLQQGKSDAALILCKEILKREPESFDANQIAGVITLQNGLFKEALSYFDRALKVDNRNIRVWSNRSLALSGLKKFKEAHDSVDQAIALDEQFAESWYNKATIYIKQEQLQKAIESLDRFIQIKPNHHVAIYLMSDLLRKLEKFDLAISATKKVIELKPDHTHALINLGQLLSDQEQYEEALLYLHAALKIEPHNPLIHNNIGVSLERIGKFAEALKYFSKAVELNPIFADAILNCGVVQEKLGKLEEAIENYDRILAVDDRNAAAYFNRATCYERLHKLEDSINDYNKAMQLEPKKKIDALWNRSLVLLCKGEYELGWREYEVRLKLGNSEAFYETERLKAFYWDGNPDLIKNKSLMVKSEQGLGDTIQFCRYVKLLSAMGAKVTLRVQKPLMNVLQGLEGLENLNSDADPYPEFDYYCNLMSLPLLLKTTVESIPNEIPYLKADPDKVKAWADRLGPKVNKRVGLVWSGGFRPDRPDLWLLNRRRNIELIQLIGLKTEGIEFHSLQKGELPEAELVVQHLQNWDGPKIINHADQLTDFTETAALIENLDLLISVDTSTPHLAGALGKPVWLMNRFDTCWRWFLHRSDSPWYPTFRIFRQKSYDDWTPVVEGVKTALDEYAKT
jgi:tetratricopeptide (TPR) repeat protein